MSNSPWARAFRWALAALAGAGLAAATLAPGGIAAAAPPASQSDGFTDGTYIVSFVQDPAATYTGGLAGYEPTRPAPGTKLDTRAAQVRKYQNMLERKHDDVLSRVGAEPIYDYSLVLNGVAARLTAEQARELSKAPDVQALTKARLQQPTTNVSPAFLGLPKGLWPAAGGQSKAGSGIVVGVIDSGIWPESRSFADNGTPVPAGWQGVCEAGEQFPATSCNSKLIGARFYAEGFGVQNIAEEDYLSPRDGNGHGTHTASTAAGNRVRAVTVDANKLGTLSGMAPGAKVAAYKVCWTGRTADGCSTADSVAAIEDAVADGVDVINYSLGSTTESSVLDPVEFAFLRAAAAGVFVSAAAGNSGPDAGTLDHPSPWVTTVAASTFKISEKALELADGRRFVGASTTGDQPGLTPMVLAAEAPAAGSTAAQSALCLPGSLDPALVGGKLVVCERGVNPRLEKSFVVRDAGGVGMVLINRTPGSLNGDLHAVPSVHLDDEAFQPVTAYVATDPDPRGRIVPLRSGESATKVPEVAEFSSRGPSTTTGGDILKPDLSAPGVDVAAAVAPPFNYGRDYNLLSGTSMAAPHIAGIAAVLMQLHPDWSPMAVKSALMTTAVDNASTSDPFAQGAGFVQPNPANDPGIVFDSGPEQWLGYLEQVLGRDVFRGIDPVEGSQVNQASIAVGALAGTETVTRTLTNVGSRSELYRVRAQLPGVDVIVSDSRFVLARGESKTISITFIRRSEASFDRYTTGFLTFSGNRGHRARVPLAVRPVPGAVSPAEVRGTAPQGSAEVTVTSGFTGTMRTAVAGLAGITPEPDSVTADPGAFDPRAPGDPGESVDSRPITVAEGSTLLRLAVDGADDADLDLWLYRLVDGAQQLVAFSAGGSAEEQVTLTDPAPGSYVAYVHGFAAPTSGDYRWSQWVLDGTAAGNLTVSPPSQAVTIGADARFTVAWSGLDPAQRYLGWVGFSSGATPVGRSIVSVG